MGQWAVGQWAVDSHLPWIVVVITSAVLAAPPSACFTLSDQYFFTSLGMVNRRARTSGASVGAPLVLIYHAMSRIEREGITELELQWGCVETNTFTRSKTTCFKQSAL